MIKHPYKIAIVLGLVVYLLYRATLPLVNVGYADSDQFLTIGYSLGVAEPPGYPLYLLLLNLVLHHPVKGADIAYMGHLLSAILGAMTITIVYLSIHEVLKVRNPKTNQKLIPFISLIASVGLAASHVFWLYNTIAEKFAFLGFLLSLTLLSLIKYCGPAKNRNMMWGLLTSAFLGLAISQHPISLLMIIPFGYIQLIKSRRYVKRILLNFLSLILFWVLPLGIVWILNLTNAPVSWHFNATFMGWFGHTITGVITGLVNQFNLNRGLMALIPYSLITLKGFGWWIVVPLLLFIQKYISKRNSIDVVLFTTFICFGVIVPIMFQWPENDWNAQSLIIGYYYPGYIFLTLLIAIGLADGLTRLLVFFRMLGSKTNLIYLVYVLPLIALGIQLASNYPLNNLSQFSQVRDRYQSILNQVNSQSIVTCFSRVACNALLYEQVVNHLRPDVDIIPTQSFLVTQTLSKPDIKGFGYPDNPYLMQDIITWNLDKRSVYAVELDSYYYQLLGIDVPFMYYLPRGYFGEFLRTLPKEIPAPPDYSQSLTWIQTPLSSTDPARLFLQSALARDHLTNAQQYLKMDKRDWALAELNLATNLFYQFGSIEKDQIEGIRTNMEQSLPLEKFSPGSTVESAANLIKYIPDLLKNNHRSRALQAAQGAVIVDPRFVPARIQLAQFYEEMGDPLFVYLEYQNVLRLDPKNQIAQEKLASFNNK